MSGTDVQLHLNAHETAQRIQGSGQMYTRVSGAAMVGFPTQRCRWGLPPPLLCLLYLLMWPGVTATA